MAATAPPAQGDAPITKVAISGLAVLKLTNHCTSNMPSLVTGQLLGLDVDNTLEVTDCFPFPGGDDAADVEEADGESFQLDMMRCLREINVDNNHVGWYQSTAYGSFQTVELLETFLSYQESLRKCVCLIYDPNLAAYGGLPLKAVRVKDSFAAVYRSTMGGAERLTMDKLRKNNLGWADIFEEVPIEVRNSALASAVMHCLRGVESMDEGDYGRLDLAVRPVLDKSLDYLNECLDDLLIENHKMSNYFKALSRQQLYIQSWQQKRRLENAARKAAGEELLPEDDPSILKPIAEPPQLDRLLISNQIATYAQQLGSFSGQAIQKINMAARVLGSE